MDVPNTTLFLHGLMVQDDGALPRSSFKHAAAIADTAMWEWVTLLASSPPALHTSAALGGGHLSTATIQWAPLPLRMAEAPARKSGALPPISHAVARGESSPQSALSSQTCVMATLVMVELINHYRGATQ